MSTYLVIKNGSQTKKYNVKSTHTNTPYLKINATGYLDLTTNTINGIKAKVKVNNATYRIVETTTTMTSRSSEYTETTGYSGYRESTSGYSGSLSQKSTSGYSGSLSQKSTSGYTGQSSREWEVSNTNSNGMYNTTIIQFHVTSVTSNGYGDFYGTSKRYQGNPAAQNLSGTWYYTVSVYNKSKVQYKQGGAAWNVYPANIYYTTMNYWTTANFNNPPGTVFTTGTWGVRESWVDGTSWKGKSSTSQWSSNGNGAGLYNIRPLTRASYYSATSTAVGNLSSTTPLTRASYYGVTSTAIGNLSSAVALTRASYYGVTSTAIGNLSSTAALTRASYYSATSTAIGNLSSTAALTRASATTSTARGTLSSITELTITNSKQSDYNTTIEV